MFTPLCNPIGSPLEAQRAITLRCQQQSHPGPTLTYSTVPAGMLATFEKNPHPMIPPQMLVFRILAGPSCFCGIPS
ncbi:uncharacterized protein CLUP02_06088 [Colletotrichum lupini]|uniref:Uncharacterized protein n=1 Tax=Colletotrichum lupini TaxID=145971 RepID=A0A9Q8SPC7_9PEZI|nr:uncharacterized protein CLUP02_06088 [Colletotrichum lupini]UQC80605.1 hypothetical protein CLUP02_06088 [Colletotrichum lupini]